VRGHWPYVKAPITLEVSSKAVPYHVRHGDSLGPCPDDDDKDHDTDSDRDHDTDDHKSDDRSDDRSYDRSRHRSWRWWR
jgi:hypothetical protein